MNLVAFSIRTKGVHNFGRRLWTVFARFGFSEGPARRTLFTLVRALKPYNAAPTFFIPAVVLNRHPELIAAVASSGAEIGVHGYVHNDYRTLSGEQQFRQTQRAVGIFEKMRIQYAGFRNPYLGWTEESLQVFEQLGFGYESNEAIFHDVVDLERFSPLLQSGFQKSLALFQAIPCSTYTLRPHFEGQLLRIPTCIPDDEMLFDRLRITDPEEVGQIWSQVMQRVYERGGLYTLNIHPERGLLCQRALEKLLAFAHSRPRPVWITRLKEIAAWWRERGAFRFRITPLAENAWQIEAKCTDRASILARNLEVCDQETMPNAAKVAQVQARSFQVYAAQRPCIGLSRATPLEVRDFLNEQGYAVEVCDAAQAESYALYFDLPEGLGTERVTRMERRSNLVEQIETSEAPLLSFGVWPSEFQAALSISGDIDSVTIQDFFLRIVEVAQR